MSTAVVSTAVVSTAGAERSALEQAWCRQVALLTQLSVAYHHLTAAAGGSRSDEGRRTRRRRRKLMADVAAVRLALARIEAALRLTEPAAGLCRGCRSELSLEDNEPRSRDGRASHYEAICVPADSV